MGSSGRGSHFEGNDQQLGYTSGDEPVEVFSAGDSGSDVERAGGREGIGPAVADTDSARPKGHGLTSNSETMAHTTSSRRPEDRGNVSRDSKEASSGRPSGDAGRSNTHAAWPPGREGDWAGYIAKGGPEPSVRRGTDGAPVGLADTLHLGGNGLVPAVAAAAFIELLNRHQH